MGGLNFFDLGRMMPRSIKGFPDQAKSVADVLEDPDWPKERPYEPQDFTRQDEADDNDFYDQPRFCYHVDDAAVAALTKHYSTAFREWEKPAILDICASHVSHFPPDVADYAGRRVALGMNGLELSQNKEVTRVLKPGGQAMFSLSNRCFPSKAVNVWLKTNDLEHVFIVGSYFHYGGGFKSPSAIEISPGGVISSGGSSQNNAYLTVVKATVDK